MTWKASVPLTALLALQSLAGAALAFRPFSLNTWEPNEGFNLKRDWLAVGTGVLLLLGAGLGWYGYTHNLRRWWFDGFNEFTLLKWSVNTMAVAFALALACRNRGTVSTMRLLRSFLCWNFALCSAICIWFALWLTVGAIQRHGTTLPLSVWLLNGVLPVEAAVLAAAWWFIWQKRSSAKVWGIAASLMFILNAVWFYARTARIQWVLLVVGVTGLVAFVQHDEEMIAASLGSENREEGSE